MRGRGGKWRTLPFRAWDTEGLGRGRHHRCVMLVTDDGPVVRSDPDGLSTRRLLGALWRGLSDRSSLHVSFAFGYDVQMILKDVPRRTLATLWTTGTARVGPYQISYTPRHTFEIAKRVGTTTVGGKQYGGQWVRGTLWDTFGFFQSSFVAALRKYGVADALVGPIAAMKARRAHFTRRDLPAMERYSQWEGRALVALMEAVRAACLDVGLPMQRWDGAGAVASALLKLHQTDGMIPPSPAPVKLDPWPAAVRDAGRSAYFGGRIEVGQVGHHAGRVVRYDVRSAYPAVLATLPDGRGRWHADDLVPDNPATLYYLRWDFGPGRRWYPFPWRARDGAVLYPRAGEGWVWAPEVWAARDAVQLRLLPFPSLELEAVWQYRSPHPSPWAWVADRYRQRQQWVQEQRASEKILKLALNSLYGKTAQTLGGSPESAPRWHCLEWAGLVTSTIRARLFRAAVAAGDRAVAIATDGLFTTGPVRALDQDVGPGLGQWERSRFRSGTWVQSGVYWVGTGAEEAAYHRGFSPAVLHRDDVRAAWAAGRAALTVQETRFQGVGASTVSDGAYDRRGQWTTADRTLHLVPYAGQKRYVNVRPRSLARGLHWTTPRPAQVAESWDGRTLTSAPLSLPWRTDGVTPPDHRASLETDPDTD